MKSHSRFKNISLVFLVVVPVIVIGVFVHLGGARADRVATPYTRTDQRLIKGAFDIIGNTVMTCDENATPASGIHPDECVAARNYDGSVSSGGQRNNGQQMKYVDTDGDSSTYNSSSARLNLPSGATVKYARLFWSMRNTVFDQDLVIQNMKFKKANGTYQTITSQATQIDRRPDNSIDHIEYSTDVTSYVTQNGSGDYFGANIPANVGRDKSGGWGLYVVYEKADDPQRLITLFDGNVYEDSSGTRTDVTVSGFQPNSDSDSMGNVRIGTQVWDGDKGPATVGAAVNDRLYINSAPANFATNGTNDRQNNDMFVSNITDVNGDLVGSPNRNPGYQNTFGQDILNFDGTNLISTNDSSLTVGAQALGDDNFWIDFIAIQVDVIEPIVHIEKTATSQTNPTLPGGTIDYTITFGPDQASITNAHIEDHIPLGTSYIPGSLKITQDDGDGGNVGDKTDESADDTAEFTSGNPHKVNFRVGQGASATQGGTLTPGQRVKVTFSVKLDADDSNEAGRCPILFDPGYYNNGQGDDTKSPDQDGKKETVDNKASGYFQGGSADAPFDYAASPAVSNTTLTPIECLPKAPATGFSMGSPLGLTVIGASGLSIMGYRIKKRRLGSIFSRSRKR